LKRLVFTAATLALVFPAQAFAHATLEQASPGFRQRLASSPRLITLSFDQYVKVLPGSVQLFSTKHAVPVRRVWTDRFVLKASLPRLPQGAYTVRWHALSSDGHVVSGVFTFGVRANAPPPTEAFGASGPTTSEHLVRWLYFLALALVVGGLGFRLLVLRRGSLTPPAENASTSPSGSA